MIYILLSTYNGQRFLPELIASIQTQSIANWRLLVRDDGSCDASRELMAAASAADARISIVDDSLGRQGRAQSFGLLMEEALRQGADYLMFADQDDVWLPFKIEQQLIAARGLEGAFGKRLPVLVHTDLTVVDERLQVRLRSMVRGLPGGSSEFDSLAPRLLYNRVTGCAALVNRRLAQLALPLPKAALMHDWWLALVAASCGRVEFVDLSTVLYRQHGGNAVGALGILAKLNPLRRDFVPRLFRALDDLPRAIEQAAVLNARLRTLRIDYPDTALILLDQFRAVFASHMPWWRRYRSLQALGVTGVSPLRRAVLALRLMLYRQHSASGITTGIDPLSAEPRPEMLRRVA